MDTKIDRRFLMKYAAEMGSGAMIYIPSFIKIGSGIHKMMVGGTQAHTWEGVCMCLI
jgi:hypothetical protein